MDLVKSGLTGGLPKRGRAVVSISRLLEDPENERKTFRDMDGLIESVRVHGIVEPITVTPDGDQYRILTGHRRFRAAKGAGLTEVEVLIREPDQPFTRRLKSIISNIQREDIGAVELAGTLQAMLDEGNVGSQRELARLIGKGETWVSDILRVLSLPSNLLDRLESADVLIGYDIAMRIARAGDARTQEELVEMATRGESGRSIRRHMDAKHAATPGKKPKRRKTEQFSEIRDGYTAIVRGPLAADAKPKMRAAVVALLDSLDTAA